jgi:hypothetical protein
LLRSCSLLVSANSSVKSTLGMFGFHFGGRQSIKSLAVSIHRPGCSQPSNVRSW